MQSASVFRTASGCGLFLAALLGSAIASADEESDKAACGAAYEQTQTLRQSGQIGAARAQAALCLRDACAEFVRTSCGKWLQELQAAQPSVVFSAKDASGRDTHAVNISLDGKPWLTGLDDKSHDVDPGTHKFRYEIAGSPPVEASVDILEGDRNRQLQITFAKTGGGTDGVNTTPSGAQPDPNGPASDASPPRADQDGGFWSPVRIGGFIVGSLGLVGVAAGIGVGASGAAKTGTAANAFDAAKAKKDTAGENAALAEHASGHNQAIAGWVTTGVGGAALVAGIIMIAAAPRAHNETSVHVTLTPNLGWRAGGLVAEGSF